MPKQKDSAVHMRLDSELAERIDALAEKTDMTRSEMIRSLIAKGLNDQPTFPLAKFLVFAPETKALYAILVPKDEGGARVLHWDITENLYSELHSLSNLKELVAADADVLYWEV